MNGIHGHKSLLTALGTLKSVGSSGTQGGCVKGPFPSFSLSSRMWWWCWTGWVLCFQKAMYHLTFVSTTETPSQRPDALSFFSFLYLPPWNPGQPLSFWSFWLMNALAADTVDRNHLTLPSAFHLSQSSEGLCLTEKTLAWTPKSCWGLSAGGAKI